MKRCAILVQNPALGAALQMSLLHPHRFQEHEICSLVVGKSPDNDRSALEFQKLADELCSYLADSRRPGFASQFLVFTDFYGYGLNTSTDTLNPTNSAGGWGTVLGMLILAFPEIQWVFCGGQVPPTKLKSAHDGSPEGISLALKLKDIGYLPMFDGSGLRDGVRQAASKVARYLPTRSMTAISMDEESDYALLHAYCAFRNGFRSIAVTTRGLAIEVLQESARTTSKDKSANRVGFDRDLVLVFEDIFLSFPDGDKLSNLKGRVATLPRLNDIQHRILVTSDQRTQDDYGRWSDNQQFIRERRLRGQRIRKLHKPHAGMFDVWEQARLDRALRWSSEDGGIHTRGVADHYVWPPEDFHEQNQGHSAPGLLLVISNYLIARAESLIEAGSNSFPDEILGAVLTGEALELLGGKTPTSSAKALQMKHFFEVQAECHFSGVEYHIPMRSRIKEVKRDASAISRWFHRSEQKRAFLNIQMNVINGLVRVLRENNQFDEEQICMNHVRGLHNDLWMRQKPWRWVYWPILRYMEVLLSSLGAFFIALVFWVGGLTALFTFWEPEAETAKSQEIMGIVTNPGVDLNSFGQAFSTFFGTEAMASPHPAWVILTVCAVVVGLAHLGVFISHVYSIVSRK